MEEPVAAPVLLESSFEIAPIAHLVNRFVLDQTLENARIRAFVDALQFEIIGVDGGAE